MQTNLMAAPKNNAFWKLRSKHGRDKIFESPDMLWTACCEYFEACEKSQWEGQKVFSNGRRMSEKYLRVFTLNGLFVFLDTNRKTWDLYRQREDFIPVIERVELIIYDQKFTAAAAGLVKENIIARELGLADKSAIDFDKLSDRELDYMIEEIMKKHEQRSSNEQKG